MPVLHHYPLSAPSRFVRLALAEHGETPELSIESPGERREDFLRINPAGTVPVLIDDDRTVVVGPAPIAEYLNETRGNGTADRALMPPTAAGRAEDRKSVV